MKMISLSIIPKKSLAEFKGDDMAVEIEIYFDDLKSEVQKEFLEKLGTTPEDENWDVFPIAVFEREEDV